MSTTNKVQIDNTATSTSTGTSYTISSPPKPERGWECPRCGRINAPWKSYCDCAGGYWYPTWYPWDYKEPWWKQVTCYSDSSGIKNPCCDADTFKIHPESITWQAPSSVCQCDTKTNHKAGDNVTAWNVKVDGNTYTSNSNLQVGGSDYPDGHGGYTNIPKNQTNIRG